MDEFLIIINDQYDMDLCERYVLKAKRFFEKTGAKVDHRYYLRDDFTLVAFSRKNSEKSMFIDTIQKNFLFWNGTWFFRNRQNSKKNNPALLLNKLLLNTKDALSGIEGIYNFVIYDDSKHILKIITDRMSLLQLYQRKVGNIEFFSSSCLLLASIEPFELDNLGLKEFLLANKLFNNNTLFSSIKKVSHAAIIEFKQNKKSTSSYWSIPFGSQTKDIAIDDKVEILAWELKNIMERIGELFDSPFVDLTGGWDSRTIGITMAGSKVDFSTVTSGSPGDKDCIIAKRIAQELGVKHYFNESFLNSDSFSSDDFIKYLNESIFLTDGSMPSPLYISTLVNQKRNLDEGADISINGSGGELFRSYWWEPAQVYNSDFKGFKIAMPGVTTYYNKKELARRVIHQDSDLSIFSPDFNVDIYETVTNSFDPENEEVMTVSNVDQIAHIYISHRMRNWLAGYCSATSRFLPCISPLLLSKPVEIATQLRPKEKRFCNLSRKYNLKINPKIAKIPLGYGYPSGPLKINNCFHFLPAVKISANDLFWKIGNRMGVSRKINVDDNYKKNMSKVREITDLKPENMKTLNIFNKERLIFFLDKSKSNDFKYSQLYENIYSVEAILRLLS